MAEWHEVVDRALAEVCGGELVTKWVVIAETINADGESQIETMSSLNACHWDQLGMLAYMAAFTAKRIEVREDE